MNFAEFLRTRFLQNASEQLVKQSINFQIEIKVYHFYKVFYKKIRGTLFPFGCSIPLHVQLLRFEVYVEG